VVSRAQRDVSGCPGGRGAVRAIVRHRGVRRPDSIRSARSRTPYAYPVDGASLPVDQRLAVASAAVKLRLAAVSQDVWQRLIIEIPELKVDDALVSLLAASVEANVSTLLDVLEHGMALDNLDAPAAAIEYARRVAQRGIPLHALIRAYRIGHARFLQWCLDEVPQQTDDAVVAHALMGRLLEQSFCYIDRVSEQMISAYQHERDRWLLTQGAVRAVRVRALLDHDRVDVGRTEATLGYRLNQHHVGIIAWMAEACSSGEALTKLDRLSAGLAEELNCRGRPLYVPYDESAAWSWLPMGSQKHVAWERLTHAVAAQGSTVRVAIGDPAAGVDGFRQTHRQALRAQGVAIAARPGTQLTTFAEVGPIALLSTDLEATRGWVWLVLGALATDDEPTGRLRETMRVFLAANGSYQTAAERLAIHKNTVQYRIRKAQEAIGRPIQDQRSDLELALRICHYLGSVALRPVGK
jgi:DNA-binding PucR family transcriptional regulator